MNGATKAGEPLVGVRDLVKHFPTRRRLRRHGGTVRAVDGVSFDLRAGETLALVGESGCGKSTVARCVMRFVKPTAGRITYRGTDVTHYSKRRLRPLRDVVQIVFQDPYASLNPRMSVRDLVAEPLRIRGLDPAVMRTRADELLDRVGLDRRLRDRYPHEFSGGQRQRIAIARALALRPRVVVLDEPVSALDVSVQAQVIGLLQDLQAELGLAYLFISHDLSVVHHLADRVAVMYLGRMVEEGACDEVFASPVHPYTRALLSAAPITDPTQRGRRRRIILTGDVPSPADPPSGCRFRTRCWKAADICAHAVPNLIERGTAGHPAACHFPE
jgi:oligopeptide/dipeptide ABC transporter ATP-binding protein